MGKRRLQLRAAAAANSAASLHRRSSTISKDAPIHRGRKKRLEAKRRLEKKKIFIKTEVEKLEKESEQKRAQQRKSKNTDLGPALAVLGKIADELKHDQSQSETPNYRNRSVTNHRQRTKIALEEGEQVKRVQQHEAFKSNPIEALRQHLMNTVSSNPSEVPPPLEPGTAGAPKKRKQRVGETQKASKDDAVSGIRVPDKKALEKLREEAKERVARKREEKAAYAAAAQKLKRRKTSGKIEKQTLSGLLARGSRGRIGVKRPKI